MIIVKILFLICGKQYCYIRCPKLDIEFSSLPIFSTCEGKKLNIFASQAIIQEVHLYLLRLGVAIGFPIRPQVINKYR